MSDQLLYIYTGPAADAARFLLEHTVLRGCTQSSPDAEWMGAKAVRVELTTPRPSSGERYLWEIVRDLTYGDDLTLDLRAAGHLDDANRAALAEALSIALTDTVDIEPAVGGVSA